MREEIEATRAEYGDERRTRIVERAAAQAIEETELLANEPVTVVLSTGGWVRSAKGHDIDPRALSYKSGDAFQAAARGRSTQLAVFIDSTGRAYSLPAHTLPSARGQGEPLSGRLDPPDGARFAGVLIGEPEDLWLLATDAGYGFTVRLKELHSRNRSGKAVLKLTERAQVLPPAPVPPLAEGQPAADARVALVNSRGPAAGVPGQRGSRAAARQGQQAVRHSDQEGRAREERSSRCAVLGAGQSLAVFSGERQMKLSPPDLRAYVGERAQRGALLPRGWRTVERIASI